MISTGYAFASAYLKGEEARVVGADHLTRLLRASDVQDALAVIKDTDIGDYLAGLSLRTFAEIEEHLWVYFHDCLQRIDQFEQLPSGMSRLLKAYVVKYDVLNVKAALWAVSSGRQLPMVPVGRIHGNALLESLAQAEDLNHIMVILTRCKLGNYADILQEHETGIAAAGKSILLAQAKLDGEYFRDMLHTAGTVTDGDLLSMAFGLIIDLRNLQLVCRTVVGGMESDAANYAIPGGYLITPTALRHMLSSRLTDIPEKLADPRYRGIADEIVVSYERTGNIATAQGIIDNHKFRLLEEMLSPKLMSPPVMAWYLILKESELRNVRLVLKTIMDRMPAEKTRDYMVVRT